MILKVNGVPLEGFTPKGDFSAIASHPSGAQLYDQGVNAFSHGDALGLVRNAWDVTTHPASWWDYTVHGFQQTAHIATDLAVNAAHTLVNLGDSIFSNLL